ncbi:MAG: carbohydrate ABC transporter permease [Aggregatilineaceae bacterium]
MSRVTKTLDRLRQYGHTARQTWRSPSFVIDANIAWNHVIVAGSVMLSLYLSGLEGFYNLGDAVQRFVSLVALIPAILAVFSSILINRRRAIGRTLSLAANYIGMVLAAVYLLHLWGVFVGVDSLARALHAHWQWLLGFAVAYALFWLAGRLREDSRPRVWLEQIALGIGMITLVVLLLVMGAVHAIGHILSTYSRWETWLVTLAIVVFGTLGYRMLLLGQYFGETPDQRTAWQGWLMLSPNAIGFMLFFAGPLLLSFYLSFTDSTGVNPPNFVGTANYRELLSIQIRTQDTLEGEPQQVLDRGYLVLETFKVGSQRVVIGARDTQFWQSLRNTIVFCLMLVPLSIIPALALALVLNSKIPGMNFFRALFFLPSVAAVVGTALIWRWLYNANIGYINYAISQVVQFVNDTFGLGVKDPKYNWLTDNSTMLISIVFLAAWQLIGFNTVLFLAGLQGVPRILYEAAYVDGAGRWGQFRHVTLPMIAPTTFFVVVTTIITGLQVFNEPYALIPQRPIPLPATTSVYYLYRRGFFNFEFGYASAVAWLLFAIIFVVTLVQFRISRAGAYD